VLLVAACAREVIIGKNWRNLRVIGIIVLMLAGNIAFHAEAHVRGHAEYGTRVGIAAIVLLLALIGGRIIPSFTRNWLVRENAGRLPEPFSYFDGAAIAVSAVALALWIAQPSGWLSAATLLVAAVLNVVRLARWAGDRTTRDRLVLILHVGYGFVPLGFLLAGLGALDMIVASAAIHAWMVGAAGTLTLAVMTRASLGHTGNALAASPATQTIYLAVVIAALAPGFSGQQSLQLAVDNARLMLPYLAFAGPTAVMMALLNAQGRFALAAFSPLLFNVALISVIGILIFGQPDAVNTIL